MASVSKKTAAALARRIKSYNSRGRSDDKIVMTMHRPGSQNRKKGMSVKGPDQTRGRKSR